MRYYFAFADCWLTCCMVQCEMQEISSSCIIHQETMLQCLKYVFWFDMVYATTRNQRLLDAQLQLFSIVLQPLWSTQKLLIIALAVPHKLTNYGRPRWKVLFSWSCVGCLWMINTDNDNTIWFGIWSRSSWFLNSNVLQSSGFNETFVLCMCFANILLILTTKTEESRREKHSCVSMRSYALKFS